MNVVDMVMAQAFAQNDPNTAMARDWMRKQTETMAQDLVDRKGETIEKIEAKLAKAQERNADPAVIDAYNKLLAEAIGR